MRNKYFQLCIIFILGVIVGMRVLVHYPTTSPAYFQKQTSAHTILAKNSPEQKGAKGLAKKSIQPTVPKEYSAPQLFLVTKVVDGDTFDALIDGVTKRIRPIGMDTPETIDPRKTIQCFGREASHKASELLLNKNVRLEKDPTQGDRDIYGRLLRYVYRDDGLFFNHWMIENGYAHEYTYKVPYVHQKEFKASQTSAQKQEKGLWAPDACPGR